MSPSFVNNNSHPVRVAKPRGGGRPDELIRVVPGQVIPADGEFADNLGSTPGVAEASSADARSWEQETEGRATQGVMPGAGSRLGAKQAIGAVRLAVRQIVTAAPLRRVVGDDAAPFGPSSGVITTKGKVVEGLKPGDPVRQAFADHEALPGEEIDHAGVPEPGLPSSVVPTAEEIHNAQVANAEQAESFAQEFVVDGAELPNPFADEEEGDDDDDGEGDGFPEPREVSEPVEELEQEAAEREEGQEAPQGASEADSGPDSEPQGQAKLTGEALDKRAAELDVEGRSEMTADQKREAIAKREAELAG